MTAAEGGRIRSLEYLNRRVSFDGMEYRLNGRKLVPMSDIDGLTDAHGKGWILYECKHGDSMPPAGQLLTIERLIDGLTEGGKPAVAYVCSHGDCETVLLKDCIVTAYYTTARGWKKYGRDFTKRLTAKQVTDVFLRKNAPEMLPGEDDARG